MDFSKNIFDVHKGKDRHDDHDYNPGINKNTQGIRIFCPQCLTEVYHTSKLCPNCGKKLMFMLCQNCGLYLTIGANFCSNCGIKISN